MKCAYQLHRYEATFQISYIVYLAIWLFLLVFLAFLASWPYYFIKKRLCNKVSFILRPRNIEEREDLWPMWAFPGVKLSCRIIFIFQPFLSLGLCSARSSHGNLTFPKCRGCILVSQLIAQYFLQVNWILYSIASFTAATVALSASVRPMQKLMPSSLALDFFPSVCWMTPNIPAKLCAAAEDQDTAFHVVMYPVTLCPHSSRY